MQFLGILFCIFFIFWLIGKLLGRFWPQIAMWLLRRQVRKQMDQAFGPGAYREAKTQFDPFGDAFAPFGGKKSKGRGARDRRRAYPRSGKIIDPSVGEYVEFEEIRTNSTEAYAQNAASSRPPKFKPEPQIEDADWEEIK